MTTTAQDSTRGRTRIEPVLGTRRGTDELNFAEFPLATIAKRAPPGQKTLCFTDSIFDSGTKERVQRKLTITGSDAYGLPTALDSDVLLVCLQHTQLTNGFRECTVPFSRHEFVRRLQWRDDGKSYRRLDQSLKRWTGTTLSYEHAWWDKAGRRWASRTFHVLESLTLEGRVRRGETEGGSSFTWNEVVFESFAAQNLKPLDLGVYFRLSSAAARQAYRFLDKGFHRTRVLKFDLRVLACEHIGFSRSEDNYHLRKSLQAVFQELEDSGFLEVLPEGERFVATQRGQWCVVLVRKERAVAVAPLDSPPQGLEEELIRRGVTPARSRQLVAASEPKTIQERIAWVDWLVERKYPRTGRNPAGFLAEAIEKRYCVSADFAVHLRQRKRRAAAHGLAERCQPQASAAPQVDAAMLSWRSLSSSQQEEVLREALAEASGFHRQTYERLAVAGGRLLAEFREQLGVRQLSTGMDATRRQQKEAA